MTGGAPPGQAPGLDLGRVRAFLDRVLPAPTAGDLTAELLPGGRSNLTYLLSDGGSRWVLRRPPLGHVLSTAHDMGREYQVLTALHGLPIPVPRTYAHCTDPGVIGAPFYLMEYVEGTVYRSDAQVAEVAGRRLRRITQRLIDVLARLHGLAPDEVGLGGFGRPAGFLDRQLRRWHTQLEASRSRDIDGIDRLHRHLAADVPLTQRHVIVHGDYRLDNVVVGAQDEIAAVLDWEMATLGDPLADLGLLCVYWDAGFEPAGLPPIGELLERYAGHTGLDLTPLPWYVAFGCFKLAVIAEGIHRRFLEGATVGGGFESIGGSVAPLVSRGLDSLEGGVR